MNPFDQRSFHHPNPTVCLCAALVLSSSLLSACSNPLQRQTTIETSLSPTRTPVAATPVAVTGTSTASQPAPTQAPTSKAPSATATTAQIGAKPTAASGALSSATATAKPESVTTHFSLCSAVKPGLKAAPPTLGNTAGQIVYLTPDSNVVLTDETGRARVNVTNDAYVSSDGNAGRIYLFPTFSSDGSMLAFVSMATTADFNGITQTVHIAPATTGTTVTDVFQTSDLNIPYLDFSPDGQQIAFLAISGSFGEIRVVNKQGGNIAVFGTGAPTYWNWRRDSGAMVTHLGGRATEKGAATIAFIEAKGAAKGKEVVVDALPGNFQSPNYAPDSAHVLYVANPSTDAQQDELVLADGAGKPLCTLMAIKDNAYFAWSPDGSHVAVMDTANPLSQPATLHIFDLSDGSTKAVKDAVSAFFWSPGGDKLAVYSVITNPHFDKLGGVSAKLDSLESAARVAQTQDQIGLRIEVIDSRSGQSVKVADTYPSRQLQQYFQFFDQYSRSVSPWSPDGKHLVFTTQSPDGQTADVGVATLDAAGSVSLKRVAAGTVAFWSPK